MSVLLDRLYEALKLAPPVLRGLFYLLLLVAGVLLAPLLALTGAVFWLGHKNRLPEGDEWLAASLGTGGVLVWVLVVAGLAGYLDKPECAEMTEVCCVRE